jgi:hypothetical protein
MSTSTIADQAQTHLANTARRLYDAEVALHIARQSNVDAWIRAAGDQLHEAVLAHSTAMLAKPLRSPAE